ncbi:uncharacterized protein BJ171DRAFT_7122 [Polychytrium aggregatum]|uniref:uncharacterized protein n=1 Tax=Polychytrium aggregatum TaxID=110093 RepID=UPI0022FE3B59|nr:uncharacterized protein BJ171DRAFT_7122 [Polychytrium aggregatum]KAI9209761.1 hypothetical protein BJ171DRAFT_7122 [Polychytrium aggregatum]
MRLFPVLVGNLFVWCIHSPSGLLHGGSISRYSAFSSRLASRHCKHTCRSSRLNRRLLAGAFRLRGAIRERKRP